MTTFTKNRDVYLQLRMINDVHGLGGFSGITQSARIEKLTRTRTGTSNPRWQSQVKEGENAATDMSGTFTTMSSEPGTAWIQHTDPNFPQSRAVYFDHYRGDFAYFCGNFLVDWSPTLTSDVANNRALIAYLKKARQTVVAFSAPTFVGELRESIHMIRHPAESLRTLAKNYLDHVKNMKKAKPTQWKKNLSGAWLENAFGWQPFISDIGKAYDVYKHHTREKRVPISGFGKDEKFDRARSISALTHVGAHGLGYSSQTRVYETSVVKYRGMYVRSTTTTGTVREKLEPYGFDPLEFVPTAWELLPWSFLIDYFSNIGDVITANCAITSDIAWTNRSIVGSQVVETAAKFDKSLSNSFHSGSLVAGDGTSSTCKKTVRKVSRIANVPVGTPRIMLEVPTSPWQYANMLALFSQASKDIHPQRAYRPLYGKYVKTN